MLRTAKYLREKPVLYGGTHRQLCIKLWTALNLDYPEWYDLFKRKPLVDALLDRLRHHCITVRIDGPSLRVPEQEPDPPDQDKPS